MISRRAVWAAQADRAAVILHFQGGLLGIPDHPEQHGIHVHRHGILGQRLFGVERGDHHAVIDPDRGRVDDRHDPEHARAAQAVELAQAQHDRFFPLLGDFEREQDVKAQQHENRSPRRR